MDKIEKICQELERLKGICMAQIKTNPGQAFPFVMEMTGYDKLLSFLKTLSEELDKSLEAEIQWYLREKCSSDDEPTVSEIARYFAKWQYQKDRREFAKIRAKIWCEGFDAHKEQMLKDAIEGRVFMSFAPGHDQMVMADVDLPVNTKVRIVVLKEEEE